MGRRKIEIKAIKDDRNRSVTFLKRKGGLFKKAHELSVLCSVDVAVFIFGNNKKLYEYSSTDMNELIRRYTVHGGVNEHKGPSDFNGGNDEEEDEEGDVTPPRGPEAVDPQMMPPQFHGQQPPFSQILRHHTPSASPPIPNGVPFQGHHPHPHHPRGPTPQPQMGSRPNSRNDGRRMAPSMVPQPPHVGPQPHGPHPGITYMPAPPIYAGGNQQGMMPQPGNQYPYPPQQQQHQHQQQAYPVPVARSEPPQPQHSQHVPHPPMPHISPPPQPTQERRPQEPQPPPPVEPNTERSDRLQVRTTVDTAIKKLPQRKSHSIFTPIEENRSILSQHLASFATEPQAIKMEHSIKSEAGSGLSTNRSQSVEASGLRSGLTSSPPPKREGTQSSLDRTRNASVSSSAEDAFTPPSRANSLKVSGAVGGTRPRGPRLTVQIPDGASDPGSATVESNSPHNPAITPTQAPQRQNSHSSVVLPPPSPSASALLSAGATGPPNPFARPPPQQSVNGETPVSALPSRFLNNELLPSPSSFYPDWNFRGSDSNTLPSPLNFATPVQWPRSVNLGGGDEHHGDQRAPGPGKRKSPDYGAGAHGESHGVPNEPKRVKVEY
ncbi:hypothetical protein ACCO45_006543 [Purpureocillium lilacinum]|uniref:Uncharacterized protein n=1 Tax=Purpureocillium lilacinum TaxID=33203 RepID=A0ACC4DPS2_PURLI